MIIRFKQWSEFFKRYTTVEIKVKPFELESYVKDIGKENIISIR